MGMGPTVTLGFVGPEGEWVPVSVANPLPIGGGSSTPDEGTEPEEN